MKIFDFVQEGILRYGIEDRRIRFANRAFARIVGTRAPWHELAGMLVEDAMGSADWDSAFGGALAASGETHVIEQSFPAPDGAVRWVQFHAHVVRESGSGSRLVDAVFRDVTEFKSVEQALRAAEARTRHVLEAFPDLLFRIDREGRFLDYFSNDPGSLMASPREFLGHRVEDVLPPPIAARTRLALDAALADGGLQSYEYRLDIAGRPRWFEARMVRSGTDEVLVIAREITERKLAEEALRGSEQRYRTIASSLPNGALAILDRHGHILFSDGEEVRRGRLFPQGPVGDSRPAEPGAPADDALFEGIRPAFDGRMVTFEHQAAGSHFLVNASPLRDASGEVDQVLALAVNISERKRLQERFETIVGTLADGFALVDSGTLTFAEVNDAFCRMTGWSREDLRHMTVPDLIADDTLDGVFRRSGAIVVQQSDRFESLLQCRSGATIQVDIAVSFLPGTSQLVGIIRDITLRNRLERETLLRNSILDVFLRVPDDRMYADVLRILLDATASTQGLFGPIDRLGQLVVASRIGGPDGAADPPVLAGAGSLPDPGTFPAWAEALAQRRIVVRNPAPGASGEAPIPLPSLTVPIFLLDRVVGLIHLAGRPGEYRQEDVHLVAGISAQIAPILVARIDRETALRELRASETRFRDVTFAMGDMVWETDKDYNITYYSPQVQALLGYTPEELIGHNLAEILPPEEAEYLLKYSGPVLERGENLRDVESTNSTRDGRKVRMCSTVVPLFDEAGRYAGCRGVDRDITEKVRLEAEALKAQKLESLGVLAGGIAHDFNNILTAILGNVSLARESSAPGSEISQRLGGAEKALARAQDLTRQLLTFARGGAPVRRPSSLGAVVAESASFVLSGSNVRSSLDIPNDLWTVDIDPGQISQVIQNLVLNAIQAMPSGGTVRIAVDNCIVDRHSPLRLPPGRYVQIDVEDEGVGIAPQIGDRVFEPYFSTKSRGSGLGLPVSYSIVRNHGGHIGFESEPGKGTRFHVLLPAVDCAPEAVEPPPAGTAQGRGRLLLMDDEPMVLDVLAAMLASGGYETMTSTDGAEAIAAWRSARDAGRPFDAVLLDLTVPGGLGGLETLGALRMLDPSVRVIVSSGYHTAPVMADHEAYGFQGVISKPFRPSDVLLAVSRVLEPDRA